MRFPFLRARRFHAVPVFLLASFGWGQAQTPESQRSQARSVRLQSTTMQYRLFVPAGYSASKRYPIVVSLHGVGERGSDNRAQVDREDLAHPWIEDTVQARVPHFIMVPQCPANLTWGGMQGAGNTLSETAQGIVDALDSLRREFSLDTNRYYLTGLSMGAAGSYHLLKMRPGLFAAAVPCAAGGDTAAAAVIGRTPWWAFHGSLDGNPPGSRNMALAMERKGIRVVRFVSQVALPAPSLSAYRDAIRSGTDRVDLVAKSPTGISYDSLRRAVAAGANHLYSEVTGGDHRTGWMVAWHHPLLAAWVFSKSKAEGPVIVSPRSPRRRDARAATLSIGPVAGAPGLEIFTLQGRHIVVSGPEPRLAAPMIQPD